MLSESEKAHFIQCCESIEETPNPISYIYIIYKFYLELFMKIAQKLYLQGHTKEFQYITAYGRNFVLVNFLIDCGKHKEIHGYVCHVTYRIWNELHA